jgi:hypothetical protein
MGDIQVHCWAHAIKDCILAPPRKISRGSEEDLDVKDALVGCRELELQAGGTRDYCYNREKC